MAIIQTQTTIFKQNLLNGLENFGVGTPYTYKIALYNANANLDNTTTVYSSTNEVISNGYVAGGKALVIIPPSSSGSTAFWSFNNVVWTNVRFTCRGALIYNSTTQAAVAVLNFGSDKYAGPNFNISFPSDTATNAVLRIS